MSRRRPSRSLPALTTSWSDEPFGTRRTQARPHAPSKKRSRRPASSPLLHPPTLRLPRQALYPWHPPTPCTHPMGPRPRRPPPFHPPARDRPRPILFPNAVVAPDSAVWYHSLFSSSIFDFAPAKW